MNDQWLCTIFHRPAIRAYTVDEFHRVVNMRHPPSEGASGRCLLRSRHARPPARQPHHPRSELRIARFQSALGFAGAGAPVDWAGVAAESGYADQSHLIAEFREFSGLAPHQLASERRFHPFIERGVLRRAGIGKRC